MTKVKKDAQTSKTPKDKYQVKNWSSYNQALVGRGDVTLYFDTDVIEKWYDTRMASRGGQFVYSDFCIETLLMLKCVFRLPYRQTQGFAMGLLKLMHIDNIDVPSYTQIARRSEEVKVASHTIPSSGAIVLAIDSTGLKIFGEGEWKVRKHGYSKRRTWRKLHLGVDPETGYIHCHSLTENDVDDASQLDDLLDQVECPISDVTLDGAYDTAKSWGKLSREEITPIIPPRENAVEWFAVEPGDCDWHPRNQAIKRIEEIGRAQWKKEVGYHKRSLSETAMFRFKIIFGGHLFSRRFKRQQTETKIKIKLINKMTALGMPISEVKKAS